MVEERCMVGRKWVGEVTSRVEERCMVERKWGGGRPFENIKKRLVLVRKAEEGKVEMPCTVFIICNIFYL